VKRILWLSRHEPHENQIKELEIKFGSVKILRKSNYYSSVKEIINLMDSTNCDDIVVILPIDYLYNLVKQGVNPLVAIMRRYYNSQDKAEFSHERFVRIRDLKLENLINN